MDILAITHEFETNWFTSICNINTKHGRTDKSGLCARIIELKTNCNNIANKYQVYNDHLQQVMPEMDTKNSNIIVKY